MSGEDKHSIIRLKPKVSPDKILAGFPWVYDNELVLDRRTKQLTSGKIVELQDSARNFLATAVVNPKSKIFALDRDINSEKYVFLFLVNLF